MPKPPPSSRAFKQLTARDRKLISSWKTHGVSLAEMARRLGKHRSTLSRELKRNCEVTRFRDRLFWFEVSHCLAREDALEYLRKLDPVARERLVPSQTTRHWTASEAQRRANDRRWLSNQARRRKRRVTVAWVKQRLLDGWSPDQIAGRSKLEGPERVSHEWIYSLIVADRKRGGGLFRLLKRFRKRKQRLGARVYPSGPVIPDRVGIEERPAVVATRSRLGDLEADLVQGYRQSGFVLTVVDRRSKFVQLRKLETKHSPVVIRELARSLKSMGKVHTLTMDNGTEFTRHAELGIPTYFTHPYSSSERGTVENTNGLIRYHLPKKTSFKSLTQLELDQIQASLNHRPRRCLGYLTPHEVHRTGRAPPPVTPRSTPVLHS